MSRPANTVLTIAIGAVLVYGVALVVAGTWLGTAVFDPLGFGPGDGGIPDGAPLEYLRLVYGIIGAVIAGWMALTMVIVRGPLRDERPWAWRAVALSITVWFVLDTGLSLVTGWISHAMFNVAFTVAIGVPLVLLRPGRDQSGTFAPRRSL